MFSSHGGILTIAMYRHRGKPNQINTSYDETKKMAHGSQIARAKENLKLSPYCYPLRLKIHAYNCKAGGQQDKSWGGM